jgi:single-stranded-DNA-specific exonuclease
LTLLNTHWRIAEPPSKQDLDQFPNVDPLLVQVLFNRKIATPAAVEEFLCPRPPRFYDPFQLKGMEAAVTRIGAAIENGEPIVIYGDYDADGVTGSVLLTQALRAMGAVRVQPYIPHREKEGYGLNRKALDELAAQGNRLIITTDPTITPRDQNCRRLPPSLTPNNPVTPTRIGCWPASVLHSSWYRDSSRRGWSSMGWKRMTCLTW